MSYRKTYTAITEMILRTVLDTNMARDIVRRSGVLQGRGTGGASKSMPIWLSGSYTVQSDDAYSVFNFPASAYIYPPFASSGTLQHTLTDLTNVAYVRMWVNWRSYNNVNSRVALIPIYTNNLNDPSELAAWIAPDGRTLAQWQSDIDASSAPWPPVGSALDPVGEAELGALGTVGIRGRWAAPPVDVLTDVTSVLVGVGALVRQQPNEIRLGDVAIQTAIAPVSDTFNAQYFE